MPDDFKQDKFFNINEINSTFDNVINILNEPTFNQKPEEEKRIETKVDKIIFDIVKREEDLMLPVFYKKLLDISENNENKVTDKFIEVIRSVYIKNKKYSFLNPILTTPNIPIEILSKYYVRMYTIEGNFYKKMKEDLLEDNNENNVIYVSYIKTLYEGLSKKALKTYKGDKLYSAQFLPKEQIEELNEFKNEKKIREDLPMAIVFSKCFISFSKSKDITEKFYKENKNKNAMLTVERCDKKYKLETHAHIEDISFNQNEKEVLFFPFSAFGVERFEKVKDPFNKDREDRYEVKLIYLGKFIEKIKNDKKFDVNNDELPDNKFKEKLIKSGLIENKKVEQLKTMKISQLKQEYKKYDEKGKKRKKRKCNYSPYLST